MYFGLFSWACYYIRDLLGRSRAGPDRVIAVYQAEIKQCWALKIIFTVAVINLMFLGFELAMNVIRTAIG